MAEFSDAKKIRFFLQALKGQLRAFERIAEAKGESNIDAQIFAGVQHEIAEIERTFPGLVPTLKTEDVFSHDVGRGAYYKVTAIIMYLHRAVSRLEVASEDDASTPVTESRTFPYVTDAALQRILVRDYGDVQRAFISSLWKATILLAGGAIEAILLDQLKKAEPAAKSAAAAPKGGDLTRWDLSDLIKVAVELRVVGSGIEKLSHSIREYRNLVHPGNELRNGLNPAKEEARIALEVLNMLDRELTP